MVVEDLQNLMHAVLNGASGHVMTILKKDKIKVFC